MGDLNKHIRYITNIGTPLKKRPFGKEIENGLGIKGRKFLLVNGNEIQIPDILHPTILSAISPDNTSDSLFAVNHNGEKNGPTLEIGGAKWLEKFSVATAGFLQDPGNNTLLSDIRNLNRLDVKQHGRMGEGLYVLLDSLKSFRDGKNYKSPTLQEFKNFIVDISSLCKDERISSSSYINSMPKKLLNVLKDDKGAMFKYSMMQFPEMIRHNNRLSYFNLTSPS